MSVRVVIQKPIIRSHLFTELATAGYFVITAYLNEWFQVEDSNDTAGVQAVYNAHTGLPYPWEARCGAARIAAKNIPNWATWTQADWSTWFNANISSTQINAETTLADAKVVQNKQSLAIQALGQMLLALRDCAWPDLPEK